MNQSSGEHHFSMCFFLPFTSRARITYKGSCMGIYILIHIGSFSFTLLKLECIAVLSSVSGECSVLLALAISYSSVTIIVSLRELCFFLLG